MRAAIALVALLALLLPSLQAQPLCVSDDGLFCFSAVDRNLLWQARDGRATDAPLAVGALLLAGGADGVSAYSASGDLAWRTTRFGRAFSPRGDPGAVYAGTLAGDLVRMDPSTGQVSWRTSLPGWVYSPALLNDIVVTGGQQGTVFALEPDSGRLLWSRELGQELVYQPVRLDRDRFVVTTFDGRILAIDSHGGTLWEQRFAVPAHSPVVDGDLVYASLFDGQIIAIDSINGSLRWRHRGDRYYRLRVSASGLLVAHDQDIVTVFDRSGARLWRRQFRRVVVGVITRRDDLVIFLRDSRNHLQPLLVFSSSGESQEQENG